MSVEVEQPSEQHIHKMAPKKTVSPKKIAAKKTALKMSPKKKTAPKKISPKKNSSKTAPKKTSPNKDNEALEEVDKVDNMYLSCQLLTI